MHSAMRRFCQAFAAAAAAAATAREFVGHPSIAEKPLFAVTNSVRIALENSSNTLHTSALYLAFGTCFPVRRTTQAMPANKFHDKMYAVFCYYIRGLFSL